MPAFGPIDVDVSLWPLQIISYPAVVSIADYVRMLDWRSQALKRQERQVIVHDMSRSIILRPSEHRHIHMEWMKREEARMREWMAAVAFVTHSTPLRLMLSVIQHLRPMPMPHMVAAHLPDVTPWIESQLLQLGTGPDTRAVRARLMGSGT